MRSLIAPGLLLILAALLAVPAVVRPAAAQDAPRYTMAVRGVGLDEALERFVQATGLAVAYDPALVRPHRSYCMVSDAPAESVLRCLLAESGLDFYRLSSGTYVLREAAEAPPAFGSLSGVVVDGDSGHPLANAHVYLAGAGIGAVTNGAGQFVFPPLLPGPYTVQVSHVGYSPWRDTLWVEAERPTRARARLESEPIFITPVVVDGLQSRLPSETLGRGEIVRAGSEIAAEVQPAHPYRHLSSLPGVRLHDTTSDVHVQGGEAGDHQLRLDGVPVFLPRHLLGLLGPFSAFALDRITVHKAGFDAAQGSQIAGIVQAEQSVGGGDRLDVMVDPLSLNARLQRVFRAEEPGETAVTASVRQGLWDVHRPDRFQSVLESWSTPDLFLVVAPLGNAIPSTPGYYDGDGLLRKATNPALRFTDVHLGLRRRFGPLRTLHASAYVGRLGLEGGLLSEAFSVTQPERESPTALTVVDDYAWRNTLGQVRYDAVVGSRTLVGVQLRASFYELTHDYQILDSLRLYLGDGLFNLARASTTPIQDRNAVGTVAVEATADHARGRHQMRFGLMAEVVGSRFDVLSVRVPELGSDFESSTDFALPIAALSSRSPFTNLFDTGRLAAYAEDEVSLSRSLHVLAGTRLTFLPDRRTVYAEPRLSLRFDRRDGLLGAWSARTSAGLYRQFFNQFDASKLNAGALLPSVRIWLPVDASVRPPLAYHLAQELLLRPATSLELRLEGYYRYQPHGLAMRYALEDGGPLQDRDVDQARLLAETRGQAYGASAAATWQTRPVRLSVRYEYSRAERRSPSLFDGRTVPVPWNEPHRVEASADVRPFDRLVLTARWRGVWGRTWGFRQAYYDYFGHDPGTRRHGDVDFGRPEDHELPALLQLDLSAAYTQPLGPADLQLRLDVLNVLDRANVSEWRLQHDGTDWRISERPLYPVMPSLAARLSF